MHSQTSEPQAMPPASEYRIFWQQSSRNEGKNSTRSHYSGQEPQLRNSTNYRVLRQKDNGGQQLFLESYSRTELSSWSNSEFASFPKEQSERSPGGGMLAEFPPSQKRKSYAYPPAPARGAKHAETHRSLGVPEPSEMGKRPPGSEMEASTCKRLKMAEASTECLQTLTQEDRSPGPSALVPNLSNPHRLQPRHYCLPGNHQVSYQNVASDGATIESSQPQLAKSPHTRKSVEHILGLNSTLDNSSCFRAANIELQPDSYASLPEFDPCETAFQKDERFLQKGAHQLTLFMGEMTPKQAWRHKKTYLSTFYKREQEHEEKNAMIETYFETRKSKLEKLIRP